VWELEGGVVVGKTVDGFGDIGVATFGQRVVIVRGEGRTDLRVMSSSPNSAAPVWTAGSTG